MSIEDSLRLVYEATQAGMDKKIPTPWNSVNKLLRGGLRKKNLIVIGAPPKIGKTTITLQLCLHASKELGIPTLFFCLEMPFEELAMLAVCQNEYITEYEYNPLMAGMYSENFRNVPLYLGYQPHLKNSQIVETFTEARNRYGIELAVFDNLHWLVRSSQNVSAEVGVAMKMFKTLATSLEIPIIVIAQPRKLEVNSKGSSKIMSYWDYRDSSSIPADADVLCVMHRDRIIGSTDTNILEASFSEDCLFRVEAGRLTSGGQVQLKMRGESHRFDEV